MRFLVLPGGAPAPLPTDSLGRFLGLRTPPTPPRLPTGFLKFFWERFPVPLKTARRPPACPPPRLLRTPRLASARYYMSRRKPRTAQEKKSAETQ